MIGTVLLCLLSTLAFCGCTRGVLGLAGRDEAVRGFTHGASVAARRMVRGYLIFSLVLLATLAFAGAVVSYVDLFSLL